MSLPITSSPISLTYCMRCDISSQFILFMLNNAVTRIDCLRLNAILVVHHMYSKVLLSTEHFSCPASLLRSSQALWISSHQQFLLHLWFNLAFTETNGHIVLELSYFAFMSIYVKAEHFSEGSVVVLGRQHADRKRGGEQCTTWWMSVCYLNWSRARMRRGCAERRWWLLFAKHVPLWDRQTSRMYSQKNLNMNNLVLRAQQSNPINSWYIYV